jgi:hypothetical protein
VISGGHTDRKAGDFISPISFFESRLKISLYFKILFELTHKGIQTHINLPGYSENLNICNLIEKSAL